MKKKAIFVLVALIIFGCNNNIEKDNVKIFPTLTDKFIDIKKPGVIPVLFAEGIISTGMNELNSLFSPDFKEFYYSIVVENQFVIMKMVYNEGKWSEPEVAEFSGMYSDADPCFSPDGRWLYFISQRPVDSISKPKSDWDMWRCKKVNGQWSEPEHLDSIINSEADETYPCFTKNGTLYFSSGRQGTIGKRDIWFAQKDRDYFKEPERIEGAVNEYWEGDVYVSPEEDYMIFVSGGRPEGNGLYISFFEDGKWTNPKNMGAAINVTGNEYCPIISPDGKYLFFTSSKVVSSSHTPEKLTINKIREMYKTANEKPQHSGGDIYWVDAKIIESYKTD